MVTSPDLQVFRPGEDPRLAQRTRNPNVLGRVDARLSPANSLVARYRFDDSSATNRFIEADVRLGTGERAHDLIRRDQDLGIINTQVFGNSGFNELRVLFGRRFVDLNVDAHCGIDCPELNYPTIRLGKSFNLPQRRTEDRWQIADTFTRLLAGRTGQHTVEIGADVSFIRDDNFFPLNFAGTYTFPQSSPFDATRCQHVSHPVHEQRRLTERGSRRTTCTPSSCRTSGGPHRDSAFNGGLRWDYEDAPGIAHDRNNVAPRLGISYDLTGDARTVVRGSYGHYYDQVYLLVAREVEQAAGVAQVHINNPGYPNPLGPNPNRTGPTRFVPSATRYGDRMKTPLAAEATVGVQRELGARTVVAVDGVWARGWHLLAAHDLNYPDLNDPGRRRPDPNFQVIRA